MGIIHKYSRDLIISLGNSFVLSRLVYVSGSPLRRIIIMIRELYGDIIVLLNRRNYFKMCIFFSLHNLLLMYVWIYRFVESISAS